MPLHEQRRYRTDNVCRQPDSTTARGGGSLAIYATVFGPRGARVHTSDNELRQIFARHRQT